MFTRELDTPFNHEDVLDQDKKQVKSPRPDRVIGLGVTESLRYHLQSLQTTYCPYTLENMVYPFIVIEAKTAESSGASFGSILRQTAFVVRTCLRLQQNLQEETGITHQCIVWSFAIMGEEWRLHAAVPSGSKVAKFMKRWIIYPPSANSHVANL